MTHKIKAQDLKPGMKIEWTEYGWTHSGTVSEVQDPKRSSLFISFRAADELWMCVDKDLKVTVLAEPQPDEPTAFGACVEAAGERFVCTRPKNAYAWKQLGMGDSNSYSWYGITERGPVTVINPDPFASAEPREPRVWERIEDVPALIPFRAAGFAYTYRKTISGMERLADDGIWVVSGMALADFADYGSFAEARYV